MHNLHVRIAAAETNLATAQKIRLLHLKNQINICGRTRFFFEKWAY